jgi:hypothetical protein
MLGVYAMDLFSMTLYVHHMRKRQFATIALKRLLRQVAGEKVSGKASVIIIHMAASLIR